MLVYITQGQNWPPKKLINGKKYFQTTILKYTVCIVVIIIIVVVIPLVGNSTSKIV